MRTIRIGLTLGCALSVLLSNQGAHAKSCLDNSDCYQGFVCQLSVDAGSAIPSDSEDSEEETAAGTEREGGTLSSDDRRRQRGECVTDMEPCGSDADCDDGYQCKYYGVSSVSKSCDSEDNCTTSEPMQVDGSMYCTPPEQESCESNADCPEAAVCTEGECVFELNSCTVDSDCSARFVCTSIESQPRCDPGALLPPQYDGGVLVPQGDEPELECEEREPLGMCYPPPKACESDAECDGWICYELPEGGSPPEGYEGIDAGCMPAGLIAAIEGRIGVGGDIPTKSEGASGSVDVEDGEDEPRGSSRDAAVAVDETSSEAPNGNAQDGGDSDEAHDASAPSDGDAATAEDDDEDQSAGDDGGCGVAAGPVNTAPWFLALFAGLLVRRRPARMR